MKKIFTVFALASSMLLSCLSANAQIEAEYIHLGVGTHVFGYLGEVGQINPGLNVRAGYDFSENLTVNVNFHYGLPLTVKKDGIDDLGTYNLDEKYTFMHLGVMSNYYFVNTNEDDFGMYGILGGSLNLSSVNSELNYISVTNPLIPLPNASVTTPLSGLAINLGVGLQTNLDFAYLFGEATFNFPPFSANSRTGVTTEGNSPSYWGVNVGLRFQLGDR